MSQLHVVTREDRLSEFSGLRLLLASLRRNCPQARVSAYLKEDHIRSSGVDLRAIHPEVNLVPMDGVTGWGCKPKVLIHALSNETSADTLVLWIDTDIIVLRDFSILLATPRTTVVSAEESNPNDNSAIRLRQSLLGLGHGQSRVSTISSAVVGVRKCHIRLLEAWQQGVDSTEFQIQQGLPPAKRLLFGDQEVWEAVLCTPEFESVKVCLLRNFNEMLQATYTSYAAQQPRIREVAPFFVHATGNLKPWRTSQARFTQEMFPYFDLAQEYLNYLPPDQAKHFVSSSRLARLFKSFADFETYVKLRRAHHRVLHR